MFFTISRTERSDYSFSMKGITYNCIEKYNFSIAKRVRDCYETISLCIHFDKKKWTALFCQEFKTVCDTILKA